jgi:hypothetical protein
MAAPVSIRPPARPPDYEKRRPSANRDGGSRHEVAAGQLHQHNTPERPLGSSANASEATIYRGQAYWPLGTEPCIRKDGKPAILMRWRSRCASCGVWFEFKRSIKVPFVPNRRCDKHKRAGVRVRRLGEWEGSQ